MSCHGLVAEFPDVVKSNKILLPAGISQYLKAKLEAL